MKEDTVKDGSLHFDANMLRNAAAILRRRSRRPGSFTLLVLCRVLERTADDLDPGNCESCRQRHDASNQ